ncbi:MAG: exodeoxyribonuclease VII small subunit [Methylibium sp.]|nr:exodeoxyribonuclease VII small subunit [Methylibium sp.]
MNSKGACFSQGQAGSACAPPALAGPPCRERNEPLVINGSPEPVARRAADYNLRSAPFNRVQPLPVTDHTEPESYESALSELERLVAAMEAGQLPLDQLLESYKRGAALLAFCRGRLEAVEHQVQLLENGQLQPWNAT